MINFSLEFNLLNDNYYFYERLLVLAFSLIPTILLAVFILYTDKKQKEPFKNVAICILSGFLTISLASYLEGVVSNVISNEIALTYIWALIEEASKIIIFLMFIFDNKHYDEIYDSIVYMTLIALSFAGLENVMYAFSENTVSNSIGLALMRDFTTIPLHVICGVIIGHYLSLSNFSRDKKHKIVNFGLAIILSSLVHGSFNYSMTLINKFAVFGNNFTQLFVFQTIPLLLIMAMLFYLAIRYSRKNLKLNRQFLHNEPYEEKYSYLMSYNEYINSYSKLKRDNMYKKSKTIFYNKFEDKDDNINEN